MQRLYTQIIQLKLMRMPLTSNNWTNFGELKIALERQWITNVRRHPLKILNINYKYFYQNRISSKSVSDIKSGPHMFASGQQLCKAGNLQGRSQHLDQSRGSNDSLTSPHQIHIASITKMLHFQHVVVMFWLLMTVNEHHKCNTSIMC